MIQLTELKQEFINLVHLSKHERAERMFLIHESDPDMMDLDYLKTAAKKAKVGQIVDAWLLCLD